MHSKYKLIIFDWDGTLMDSVGRIVSSMQSVAQVLSWQTPTIEAAKGIIGLSLPEAVKTLFPQCTAVQLKEVMALYKHQYVEVDDTPTPLFEGAVTLLDTLKSHDKTLAVATGKARAGLQRVWQESKTEHYFQSSRCGDECLSKPNPDMIHSLLKELSIAPEHTLMVGDTSYDLEMAQKAGVDSIGVTYGVHSRDVLQSYQPKEIVNSCHELHNVLFD